MNVAFCVTGTDRNNPLDQRFGRAAYYGILETETGSYRVVENSAKDASGGAGTQAIQVLVDQSVNVVIAPEVGPKAFEAMKQMGIRGYKQGSATTVDAALAAWKNNQLEEVTEPGNTGLHRA